MNLRIKLHKARTEGDPNNILLIEQDLIYELIRAQQIALASLGMDNFLYTRYGDIENPEELSRSIYGYKVGRALIDEMELAEKLVRDLGLDFSIFDILLEVLDNIQSRRDDYFPSD